MGSIIDVEDRIAELGTGPGIGAERERAGDVQGAAGRQDVRQRGARDLQRAVLVDRGAAGVVLEIIELDDAVGGAAAPVKGATERITDDDARRAGEHVQRGQRDLCVARAEAVDAAVRTEGGRGISLGALGAEEPRGVAGRVAADLSHVDRRVPTGHQLQRAAVGTGHRRAEGRTDGESVRQEEARHAAQAGGRHAGGHMLGVVVDLIQRRKDREAAGPGDVRGGAEIRRLAGTEDDRAGTETSGRTCAGPGFIEIRSAGVVIASAVEFDTAGRAGDGQGSGAGDLAVDLGVDIVVGLRIEDRGFEAEQRQRAAEQHVIAGVRGRGNSRAIGVVENDRGVRQRDRAARAAQEVAVGRLAAAVDHRRSGDDEVVRDRAAGAGDEAERRARVELDRRGAERVGDRADFEHAGIDPDRAGEQGIGSRQDEITPALLDETRGARERRIDRGAVRDRVAEHAGIRGDDRRRVRAVERDRLAGTERITLRVEHQSADGDVVRHRDRAAGPREIRRIRRRERVSRRRTQTRNGFSTTRVEPEEAGSIPGTRSAGAHGRPVDVPEDIGGARFRWRGDAEEGRGDHQGRTGENSTRLSPSWHKRYWLGRSRGDDLIPSSFPVSSFQH